MVDNTLALQVQRPRFDYGAVLGQAQQLQRGGMQNDLERIQLGQAQGENDALTKYRSLSAGGDNDAAMKAISGYPDLQEKFLQVHSQLDAENQRKLEMNAQKIAKAAAVVSGYPKGSPERTAAWDSQLESLHKSGTINDDQYSQWKGKPDDDVINEALSLGETVDQILARNKAAGGRYEDLDVDTKLKIEDEAEKQAKVGTSTYETLPTDEAKKRVDGARATIIQQMGLTPPTDPSSIPAAADGTAPATPTAGDPDGMVNQPSVKGDRIPPKNQERLADTTNDATHFGGLDLTKVDARKTKVTLGPDGKPAVMRLPDGTAYTKKGQLPATHANAPMPLTKAEYDAIPSGSPIIDARDGSAKWKP